jgi:hypothetical protein
MDDKKFQSLTQAQQDMVIKIAAEAERQGVNPKLAIAIAEAETGGGFSHYRKDKVLTSPAGARGVMQIMPSTAELFNKNLGAEIDPDDEDSNIKGGVFILKHLLTKYKSPRNAVALYNASPKAVATFLKTYETDPDKAILSLPEETLNYSLRISKNFNLDDDKETGLIPIQGEAKEGTQEGGNPFEGYESESAKYKRELEDAERNNPTKKADSENKQGGVDAPEVGAMVGAGVNALLPMFTDPQVSPRVDASKAVEADLAAKDKLELARRNLGVVSPPPFDEPPMTSQSLEEIFRESQGEMERLKNEQRLAQERLKGLPKAPPAIDAPAASAPPEAPSRTKAGDPGAVNWIHSMAEGVPEVVANQALNMRADNERGGQAIIDRDMAARERQANLGLGDYGLTRTEGGVQLALPPTTVAEREAEIERQSRDNQAELERRAEEARVQQEFQTRQLEQQRLAHEAELERIRQEQSVAGQRHNDITTQVKRVAPLQRALTKAENDAEIAARKLKRAQQQPNAVGRTLERIGVGSTKMGAIPRTVVGGGLGYVGVMSYQDALARFKAGDTSEGVLKTLQAGSAGLALLPPAGKTLTKAKGLGKAVAIPTYGFDLGRRLLKERPDEQ